MNKYRLLKGDCLIRMKEIEDGSVDMVMTDPPYGTTACKWDSIIPLEPMWKELKRIIKPNGCIALMGSQPFTTKLIASNMEMFKYELIYEKQRPTSFLLAKKMFMKTHENIIIFYSKQCLYNPQMIQCKRFTKTIYPQNKKDSYTGFKGKKYLFDNKGLAYPRTILKFVNHTNSLKHPTQKPVALMEYLIKTYTNKKEIVLDFTMGSGTTGVACMNLDRKFIGIELDTKYFRDAKKRIREAKRNYDCAIK